MSTDFTDHINSLDNKVKTKIINADTRLLSLENVIQTQVPALQSDIKALTAKLNTTSESIDQKLDDAIQDLPSTIMNSSTFTSSIDDIIGPHLSALQNEFTTSIASSPPVLQLQQDLHQLRTSNSLHSSTITPMIAHHIDNSPTILRLLQQVNDLQTST
jgi:hypothetical protein